MGLEENLGEVVVHDGSFHSDDVFAVAALRIIDGSLKVIRTRNPDKIRNANMRVDVGMEYCHENGSYDHHQKGGAGTRENGIPYASFGLVWKHYGEKICGSKAVAEFVDEDLVQKIDSVDTGFARIDLDDPRTPYPLCYGVSSFNPSWHEENPDFDGAFEKAVYFAGEILSNRITEARGRNLAREITSKAIQESGGKEYVILERFCPWGETLAEEPNVKYVLFPGLSERWIVRAIPKLKGGREDYRKMFPSEWAGLSSEDLRKITGVKDALFCHNGRFIASAESLRGAKELAELAIYFQLD